LEPGKSGNKETTSSLIVVTPLLIHGKHFSEEARLQAHRFSDSKKPVFLSLLSLFA